MHSILALSEVTRKESLLKRELITPPSAILNNFLQTFQEIIVNM